MKPIQIYETNQPIHEKWKKSMKPIHNSLEWNGVSKLQPRCYCGSTGRSNRGGFHEAVLKTVVPKFQFWKNFIQLSEVHFESPEKKNMVLLFLLWWIVLSPKCQNMSKWRPEMVLFVFWHICQCKLFCKDTSCIRSVVVKWVGQQCAGPGEI